MKYKVGDKVRIKSLDWYIDCGNVCFVRNMATLCGKIVTISSILPTLEVYHIKEDGGTFNWTDEMIERLVERDGKIYPYKIGDRVVLKGRNRCATITDLKYDSFGNLSYYINIDNDKDNSIVYPTDLLLPYDNKVEGLAEEKTKPKFNVGDRIITDTNMKGKIIEDVDEGWYRVEFESYNNIPQPNGIVPEESMSLAEEESEKKLSDESWKPSKEEMDVLYSLAYITNKYDEHKEEVIARLYQDLKREFFNGSSYENMFPNTENDVRRRSTIQVLEYARSLDNYNQYGKEDIDKNIAWLERQGKSALEARTDNELIEEEVGLVDKFSSRWVNEFNLPEGYEFKDENGNIINATKIVLEKKKKEYPKTYEECARIMGVELWNTLWGEDSTEYEEQMEDLIDAFIRLKVCRDAYWKIAGEEMGLGKPWKPDWTDQESPKYCITSIKDQVEASKRYYIMNTILAFPTEEMRDAFYENFKELIESCKELL